MSQKNRNSFLTDDFTCEKYLNRMLKDKANVTNRKTGGFGSVSEKAKSSPRSNQVSSSQPRPRSKVAKSVSPDRRKAPQKEEFSTKINKVRRSRGPSESDEREAWGTLLRNNSHHDKASSFSAFDPLRTLHFLSKELQAKLKNPILDDSSVLEMVEHIQQALKRIPPELASLMHAPSNKAQLKSGSTPDPENFVFTPVTSTKTCQTPPNLTQEDTEKFQKIMEENTYRLEASCRQLEAVCTNLQTEKEMTEKELEEARENVEILCKRIKNLEEEAGQVSTLKIKELEEENRQLQNKLKLATEETGNNPVVDNLEKLVEQLKRQKSNSDGACAKLQYDITLLRMENEKFATMLKARDREMRVIQDEMVKIQEQVSVHLSKLNANVGREVAGLKLRSNLKETGDGTISSIASIDNKDKKFENLCELHYEGNAAEIEKKLDRKSEEMFQKFADMKASDTELNLVSSDAFLDDFLKNLGPLGDHNSN